MPPFQRSDIVIKPTRRQFFEALPLIYGSILLPSLPSFANDEALPTKDLVDRTFDPVRFELEDPNGGVAYMQKKIDERDWEGLMEFTKEYDQVLRKLRMGPAKKLLQSKEFKEKGTEFSNAVTFDLIGMNRSSRSGQENQEMANKYLQELRDDVTKFLQLKETILVFSP